MKRIKELVFTIVDTKPVVDQQKRNAYKYEFLSPFLDFLETDIDDKQPYPVSVPDIHKMWDYKNELNTLLSRYNSIGMDAVLDVDNFIDKLNNMNLEWVEFKTWYKETTYELRKRYYKSLLRNDQSQDVSQGSLSTLNSLKERIKNNNTF
jgi:hypothetical protein